MKKQAGLAFLTIAVGLSVVSLPSIFASAQTIQPTISDTQPVSSTPCSKYALAGIDNEEDLFSNEPGIMIGNGEAWINKFNHQLGIYAVSLTEAMKQNYELAGIEKEFTDYLYSLQKAVSTNNKEEVAKLIYYPLNVNSKGRTSVIANQTDFINAYDKIMTLPVTKSIRGQKEKDLFINDQGIMIGDGEAWISKINNKLGIYAINR
ncbi:hypothetical protein J5TS2_35160 [Brevibacillus halotolerans]|uniref:hypothetical protein n=1 Tax=Brevibacillus halotolerans TaxID=1507437 RepID=UPI001B1AD4DC|nr:hypothetical protein [Brevibacillus halotolerans]GIO02848.1 hypothetical protein J5TS2_35160 [Brevibacillus halotolerans]